MRDSKRRVVAAIPAYNEEKTIAKVLVLTKKYVDGIIVCDDGSSDLTTEIARGLGAEVSVHPRNMGYGAALATMFSYAIQDNADVLVTLDGDGQHDPSEIPNIIEPLIKGEADVVVGSRFLGRDTNMPKYRKVGVQGITKVSGAMAYNGLTDAQSGFRAYSRKAFGILAPSEMGMGASTEILAKAKDSGLKVAEVPITVNYDGDSSTHNPAFHGLDVVLSTVKHLSIRHPLVFYGIPGFLLLFVSAGFWYWTFRVFATRGTVFTNVALIAVASTIVGLLLISIAVLLWVLISVVRERHGA